MRTSKNNTKVKHFMQHFRSAALLAVGCSIFISCSSDSGEGGDSYYDEYKETEGATATTEEEKPVDDGKGIGPVKTVEIGAEVDQALAEKGKALFEAKCTACHQLSEQKIVGPGLKGVTERRKPEWIMNMIVNPEEMTKKDPQAKKLLAEHLTQMTNQNVTEDDARAMLEYLRQNDAAVN